MGNIIVLKGTSSSGKTSIIRAIQEFFLEPYIEAGVDKFMLLFTGENQPKYQYFRLMLSTSSQNCQFYRKVVINCLKITLTLLSFFNIILVDFWKLCSTQEKED